MSGPTKPRDSHMRLIQLDRHNVGPLLLRYPAEVQFEVPADRVSLCLQLLALGMQLPDHRITQYRDLRTASMVAMLHGPKFDACNAMAAVQIHRVPANRHPR